MAITMKKLNFKTLFNLNLKFCMWLMVTILDCAVLKNDSLPGQRAGYNYNDYMIQTSRIIFFHSINIYRQGGGWQEREGLEVWD